MNGLTATIIFLVLAAIEGFNGLRLAFRACRTLESVGFRYEEGLGRLIQEFGIYSFGIAAAYVIAAFDPVRFCGVALTGMGDQPCRWDHACTSLRGHLFWEHSSDDEPKL